MKPKHGDVIECPNHLCRSGWINGTRRKCGVCEGGGKVEYQEPDGVIVPPVGSWMATGRKGRSNWPVVVYSVHGKQETTRHG